MLTSIESTRRRARDVGVTLVELMIAMAIIAILAAIAYPSYQRYVARTHRSAAESCLSQYAQFMERYYTTRLTYVGANPTADCRTESNMDRHYQFSLTGAATETGYTLQAVPIGAQATLDRACGTLTLNQAGARGTSTNNVDDCW